MQVEPLTGRRRTAGATSPYCVVRVAELQPPVAQVELGVHHGAVGAVHAADDRGAEDLLVEADGLGGRRADEERGQRGVAVGPSIGDRHVSDPA